MCPHDLEQAPEESFIEKLFIKFELFCCLFSLKFPKFWQSDASAGPGVCQGWFSLSDSCQTLSAAAEPNLALAVTSGDCG